MKEKIAAIICAYNEQPTIEQIIRSIAKVPLFDEIIVVNDGSTDLTKYIIESLKGEIAIKDIHLLKNKGKGYAMAKGIENSETEILVFIDADLTNFKVEHALKLLNPLLNGNADMTLGQATETLIKPGLNPFKMLSGQRAVRKKDVLPIKERIKGTRYGVETIINMLYKGNKKRVVLVDLEKLVHPTKFQKTKPAIAVWGFIQEGIQIIKAFLSNFELILKPNFNRFISSTNLKF